MNDVRPLAISTGDPGGVGPEVALRAVATAAGDDRVVLFGDAAALRAGAARCGVAAERLRTIARGAELDLPPGAVGLVDVGAAWTGEACRHAVEGRSLYEHPDEKLGELKLIVVGSFAPESSEY